MQKELPIGWIETDFDSIISRVSNGANLEQKDVYFKDSYPISRIETIAQETIDLDRVKYVEVNEDIIDKYCLKHGDILFSHINSDKHLGKTAYFDINTPVIHGINLLLIRCNDLYNSKLLHYLFKYYRLEGKFIEVAQRAVNQSSINQKRLKEFPIPLPPLPEQQRIVAKLDTLFGHLDALKTRLDRIPQLLKDFRQKVLTQAVTGKLTEKWREGRELEEWEIYTIGKFMQEVKDKVDPFSIEETNYVGLEHFKNDGGIIKNGGSFEVKSTKSVFKKYDVLYGKLRPYLNKHDVVKFDGICSTDILVYRNANVECSSYFNYFLGTSAFLKKANSESQGINLPRISAKIINSFDIQIPPLEEQQEIVRRVESLFAKADQIEASYQKLKAKIEQLPQALLAKAFRGELVAQLPTDGNARDLLEQIKLAKKGLEKGGKSKNMNRRTVGSDHI